MLLAVEGGGFFSASASGYSQGLSLLLLGQRSEDKPMRVSPFSPYQLVDEETDPDIQLASSKNNRSRRCASFVCFGRTSGGLDNESPLKVGPSKQQHDISSREPISGERDDQVPTAHLNDGSDTTRLTPKSSLKKPRNNNPVPAEVGNEQDAPGENGSDVPCPMERRVQWTDACGSELAEIREFEPSEEDGSDDEFEIASGRTCSCAIM